MRYLTHAVLGLAAMAMAVSLSSPTALADKPAAPEQDPKITEGRLDAIGPEGKPLGPCPLKHTDVKTHISGLIAYTTVTQQFHNPFEDKIEAVYVFPMHEDAAVDAMTMTVGNRLVRGVIKERGEARQIYEAAKQKGNVAALLDQERPNIFTQSVANIEPGEKVTVEIRYSQTMDYEDGRFHFDFPMVVGPRYIPGGSLGNPQPGPAPRPQPDLRPIQGVPEVGNPAPRAVDRGPEVHNPNPTPPTEQVPDADRITPPVVKEGERAGHDISVTVTIDAGCPIADIASGQHDVTIAYTADDKSRAKITLKDKTTIPNKDFVLSYATAKKDIGDALLTHTDERGNFFTLVLQPPKRVEPAEIVPREIVFVLDSSGSMNGFPMDTSKSVMRRVLSNLREKDKFNIVTFAGRTTQLFDKPVENNAANVKKAMGFVESLQGAGGTEMMKAINLALGAHHDSDALRIVVFLTDAYVGNDMAIIDAIKKNASQSRVFSFGIGRSVNRYLIDGMASAGRGEATVVLDEKSASEAADKFYERIDAPVLTDISLDFGDLAVEQVYPSPAGVPDLFAAKPVVVKGRYTKAGKGQITLRGKTPDGPFERKIDVDLPEIDPTNSVLAPQWARAKVDFLMNNDLGNAQRGRINKELKDEIIALGIEYSLLTQYTSFVAVEEMRVTAGDKVRTIRVPVEMPEGVSHDGVFGKKGRMANFAAGGIATRRSFKAAPRPQVAAEAAKLSEDAIDLGAATNGPARELTPEQKRERTLKAKLHDELVKLVLADSKDRIEVQIVLADLSDATIAKLTELGFTEIVRAKSVKLIVGTIAADKLEKLIELDAVKRIEPSE